MRRRRMVAVASKVASKAALDRQHAGAALTDGALFVESAFGRWFALSGGMPSVSLCMIVRDEEALLGACLDSVRRMVDEMVVVDTGSHDASKRIARDAGAKVFDFAWTDDFAAARNEALRRARGDWVLVLDADERLSARGAGGLRAAVTRAKFDCGMLRLHDATRVDARFEDVVAGRERQSEVQLVPRLLRRTDGLAFVDPIHENVTPWLRRRGMRVAGVDADIVHLGATKQVVDAKDKLERNIRLLRKRVERDEADVSAYGYMAHDLLRAGEVEQAYEAVERGWPWVAHAIGTGSSPSIHRLATARAYLLIQKGRYEEARATAHIAREVEGANPDFAFLVACSFESEAVATADEETRRRQLVAARDGYLACVGFSKQVFAQSFVLGASTWSGWTRLGTVELLLGSPQTAMSAFEKALAVRPGEPEARLGCVEATLDSGNASAALGRLESLLDHKSPDAWTLAAAAVRSLGMLEDARLFARKAQGSLLQGNTFLAPHRRGRLRDEVRALSELASQRRESVLTESGSGSTPV